MNNRIEKFTGRTPISFCDLVNNYSKYDNETSYAHPITPLYLVNKVSGMMKVVPVAHIYAKKLVDGEYCNIVIRTNNLEYLASFSVRNTDKYENKLVDIVWGSFYAGNYELFLNQRDAAIRSKELLWKKKMKLDGEIAMLEKLINE